MRKAGSEECRNRFASDRRHSCFHDFLLSLFSYLDCPLQTLTERFSWQATDDGGRRQGMCYPELNHAEEACREKGMASPEGIGAASPQGVEDGIRLA